MTDFKTSLEKLHTNLHTLQQREAKHGGDAPVALLNQIADHRQAIALTEQAITGDLTEAEWRAALQPLNIDHTLIEGGFFQKILKALSLPSEQQRELRNRQIMLQRVHDFWVKSVLENSLHNEVLIELGMETKPEAVEYPWDMVIQRPDQPNRILPPGTKIIDVFDESGGSLLILGEPGSGKTTMLLELARQLIARAQADPSQPIPVVFSLSSWAEKRLPVAEWLKEELNAKYNIPKKLAQLWLKNDELLLLFDGLDEVVQQDRNACIEAVNVIQREHLVPLVVCSRIADYETTLVKLAVQQAISLQPLTEKQIDGYLTKLGPEANSLYDALSRDKTLKGLALSPLMLNTMIIAYQGKNGVVLPQESALEIQRKNLFRIYVQQMFQRRGVTKRYNKQQTQRWLTELARKIEHHHQTTFLIEQLQPSWLSISTEQWIYIFGSRLISGLIIGIIFSVLFGAFAGGEAGLGLGLLAGMTVGIIDGIRIERKKRGVESRQYLSPLQTATNILLIAVVIGLVASVGSLLLASDYLAEVFWDIGHYEATEIFSAYTQWLLEDLVMGLSRWLGNGLIFGTIFGLIFGLRSRWQNITYDIQPIEALSWSWSKAVRGGMWGVILIPLIRRVRDIVLGTADAVGISLFSWMYDEVPLSMAEEVEDWFIQLWNIFLSGWPTVWLYDAIIGAFLGALLFGINGRRIEQSVTPNQGITLSFKNAAFSGILFGLCGGLIFWVVGERLVYIEGGSFYGWRAGVLGGISLGLLAYLWYGGIDTIQHIVLRIVLAVRNYSPLRLVPFLDYCVDRIFLRRVGGGYIFIHRYLMEYFASLTEEDIERLTQEESGGRHPV